jgi:hypothetical protein
VEDDVLFGDVWSITCDPLPALCGAFPVTTAWVGYPRVVSMDTLRARPHRVLLAVITRLTVFEQALGTECGAKCNDSFKRRGLMLALQHYTNAHIPLLCALRRRAMQGRGVCDAELTGPMFVSPTTSEGFMSPWYQHAESAPPTCFSCPEIRSAVMYQHVFDSKEIRVRRQSWCQASNPELNKRKGKHVVGVVPSVTEEASDASSASEDSGTSDCDSGDEGRGECDAGIAESGDESGEEGEGVDTLDEDGVIVTNGTKVDMFGNRLDDALRRKLAEQNIQNDAQRQRVHLKAERQRGTAKESGMRTMQTWPDNNNKSPVAPTLVTPLQTMLTYPNPDNPNMLSRLVHRADTVRLEGKWSVDAEGVGGALVAISSVIFLGLTGGYAHERNPGRVAHFTARARLWQFVYGTTHNTAFMRWLKLCGKDKGGKAPCGELFFMCAMVEYIVSQCGHVAGLEEAAFPVQTWGAFPLVCVLAMSRLRAVLVRMGWKVLDPRFLSSVLATSIEAITESTGFYLPHRVVCKQTRAEALLTIVVNMRKAGIADVGDASPGLGGVVTVPDKKGGEVFVPVGVYELCNYRFGFTQHKHAVPAELAAMADDFIWPATGKRSVRAGKSRFFAIHGFDNPTVSGLCKDIEKSTEATKSFLASVCDLFVTTAVTADTFRRAFVLLTSLWRDRDEAMARRMETPEWRLQHVVDLVAVGRAFDLQTEGEMCDGVLAARDVVASMSGPGLYLLLLLSLARQRAEEVVFIPYPAHIAAQHGKILRQAYGAAVPSSAYMAHMCFSCCVLYVALVEDEEDVNMRRFVVGSNGITCAPCPKCGDVVALRKLCDRGTCSGTGTIGFCSFEVSAACRGGKGKRCGTELRSFDLSKGVLQLVDVAVAMCPWCGCTFRFEPGAFVADSVACQLCRRFRRQNGAFPAPVDVYPMVTSRPGWLPSNRRALPLVCCVCAAYVPEERARYGCFVSVYVNGGTGAVRAGAVRRLFLCKVHRCMLPSTYGGEPMTKAELLASLRGGGLLSGMSGIVERVAELSATRAKPPKLGKNAHSTVKAFEWVRLRADTPWASDAHLRRIVDSASLAAIGDNGGVVTFH